MVVDFVGSRVTVINTYIIYIFPCVCCMYVYLLCLFHSFASTPSCFLVVVVVLVIYPTFPLFLCLTTSKQTTSVLGRIAGQECVHVADKTLHKGIVLALKNCGPKKGWNVLLYHEFVAVFVHSQTMDKGSEFYRWRLLNNFHYKRFHFFLGIIGSHEWQGRVFFLNQVCPHVCIVLVKQLDNTEHVIVVYRSSSSSPVIQTSHAVLQFVHHLEQVVVVGGNLVQEFDAILHFGNHNVVFV
mmetsp:Transcript_3807/g.5686  ORF Transcript_3807/g.5686 Transcript_3807/m.5686 type:complete len:240 (+) Transcript_3807:98-817(+)